MKCYPRFVRRRLATFLFVAIAAAAAFNPALFTRAAPVRPPSPANDYEAFLARVRSSTKPGDSIVILAPARRGSEEYSFAFFRASYALAGRTVLPAVDTSGRVVAENIRAARYAAVWHGRFASTRRPVWRTPGGELLGP